MDGLFSKYGSPFLLVDGMIQTQRLSDFVDDFLSLESEKKSWEFYLHKVFDRSFDEFESSLPRKQNVSEEHLETTIKYSRSVLSGFIPTERGVNNGTI
jgi:hypothetical protein|nr:MAG TPA: hypothetical protein [Caudoviricetes sp.]